LELGDAGQSKQHAVVLDGGLGIGLPESQVGPQEVSDQHEMSVAFYSPVPQELVVAQTKYRCDILKRA
jgi:hypothetical protein